MPSINTVYSYKWARNSIWKIAQCIGFENINLIKARHFHCNINAIYAPSKPNCVFFLLSSPAQFVYPDNDQILNLTHTGHTDASKIDIDILYGQYWLNV